MFEERYCRGAADTSLLYETTQLIADQEETISHNALEDCAEREKERGANYYAE